WCGRPGLRGGLQVEGHAAEAAPSGDRPSTRNGPPPPIIEFIASTEVLDRYQEIITASGWRLESYRRNPVFQNAHQYGDIIFTLGRALISEVRVRPSTIPGQSGSDQPSTCLYQRIQFATGVNPMARIAYGLYRGKFLNAVSVGF